VPLYEADGVTAQLDGMVEPFISADGDAVVAGQPLVPSRGQETFSAPKQEGFQVYAVGLLLLCVSEGYIFFYCDHLISVSSVKKQFPQIFSKILSNVVPCLFLDRVVSLVGLGGMSYSLHE
jgi:hypothetical protein